MSSEVGEIFYRHEKKWWVAYDRDGNSAKGISKQHAKNNYLLAFGDLTDSVNVGFDLSNVERILNG